MKFFILSDIHGSIMAFEKAAAAFEKEKADYLLLGGDYLNHGPRNSLPGDYAPDKTAALLNRYADKIIGVRGNCDSEVDQMLLDFPMMGDYVLLFMNERRCFLSHGHLYSRETLIRSTAPCPRLPEGSIFISGHTHIPVLEYLFPRKENLSAGPSFGAPRGGILLVNPGSPTFPKEGSEAAYALLGGESAALKTMDGKTIREIRFAEAPGVE
jgi:putative phosphoesterase